MLRDQTESRLADPAAECFSIHISSCEKTLREAARTCVYKYHHTSLDAHEALMREVRNNPRTFYLIIADEAHWGPTSKATDKDTKPKETKENVETAEKKKAYDSLVNSWNDEEFPNVFVLQVTATPYNLLTVNSRLDLNTMCVWEDIEGKRVLRIVNPDDKCAGNRVLLHHMKWNECYDLLIQQGIRQEIKVPQKLKSDGDLFLSVGSNGEWKADLEVCTEFVLQGASTERLTIQTEDGSRTLIVNENSITGTKTRMKGEVHFVATDTLPQYKECSYHFKMSLCGQDVYLLETSDGRLKLKLDEHQTRVVGDANCEATVEKPRLEGSFVACYTQPMGVSENVNEYGSLNHLFNSMGDKEQYKRLWRGDDEFNERVAQLKKAKYCDKPFGPLTAEYALHVLSIKEVRTCKLRKQDLKTVLEAMPLACGDYTKRRDDLIQRFVEALPAENRLISRIKPHLFLKALSVFEDQVETKFLDHLEDLKTPEDVEDMDDKITTICSFLVNCLLFLRGPVLVELQKKIEYVLQGKQKHQYRKLFVAFQNLDFEKVKDLRIQENETCRLVDDLVVRKADELEGPMKIVRMTSDAGDVMYATLCLARKLAFDGDYSFEILRDYGKASIKGEEKPEAATYRIKKILQRQRCGSVENDQSCGCNSYNPTPDLTCSNCGHHHTKVETYGDLNHLPCLLIMVDKGRMGDTFPESFNTMDLRASSENKKGPNLTTLAQELGRLCRYGDKQDKKKMPYALLGQALEKKLSTDRDNFAAYYAGYSNSQTDAYIWADNVANKNHTDYNNTKTHKNRILFEAEPQIGKTGVFLCLASLLRKKIEGENYEEELLEEEQEEEGDLSQQIEGEGDREENWRYPNWEHMDIKGPVLIKKIPHGKYVDMFGFYKHGQSPRMLLSKPAQVASESNIVRRKVEDCKFRTYSKNTGQVLSKQSAHGKASYFPGGVKVDGRRVDLSVPMLHRYQPFLAKLNLSDDPRLNRQEQEMLRTWIFTPSYRRSKKAYLNFDYAMVDSKGSAVQYVHVIVVRPTEFQAYCREWGTTHAIIALPKKLSHAGNVGPEQGGVGYARLFIQLLAKEFDIPAVFMLDDNILSCSEVKFTESKEIFQKEDGKHELVSIPLYSCLHHMEQQLYGANEQSPKEQGTYLPYPGVLPGTQESFTGPWSRYGIIGMLRHHKFVYGYKKPFSRSHVMAAVLVNIRALTEKGLIYKPYHVRTDIYSV